MPSFPIQPRLLLHVSMHQLLVIGLIEPAHVEPAYAEPVQAWVRDNSYKMLEFGQRRIRVNYTKKRRGEDKRVHFLARLHAHSQLAEDFIVAVFRVGDGASVASTLAGNWVKLVMPLALACMSTLPPSPPESPVPPPLGTETSECGVSSLSESSRWRALPRFRT
ncbi:hypothetical protein BDK51DRAFT_34524 [Blyttiomyces helicus]|uniref:Uncharacterized protein n=1 Tax=Blyttiomyces helicus TaxID=388810 RepID=A0A4P9WNQ9_9FUNG|nr:hypothetical protein BDK51DRAFT_34524 [Blyttiomyces helicus]|eukprot:RKO94771.1 hypothetical protein BDK51DRAFT_34524 [Blyttiomyces helicus]